MCAKQGRQLRHEASNRCRNVPTTDISIITPVEPLSEFPIQRICSRNSQKIPLTLNLTGSGLDSVSYGYSCGFTSRSGAVSGTLTRHFERSAPDAWRYIMNSRQASRQRGAGIVLASVLALAGLGSDAVAQTTPVPLVNQ